MTTDAAPKPFAMLGDPAAEACEGDVCLIPAFTSVTAEAQQ
ncbi:MAG: hypothetical protein RLZZ608_727 [Actinomycetota bacterium]|jgi:hypothetical protein